MKWCYSMRIVDVHAHMDFDVFSDRLDDVLSSCSKEGVVSIISNGVDPQSNRRVLDLSKHHSLIRPAFGIYPTHAISMTDEELEREIEFIRSNPPIAIGEVGLDYKWASEDSGDSRKEFKDVSAQKQQFIIDRQKHVFSRMIALAKELDIPLIVHSRKAEGDVIDLLERSGYNKIIMHCFLGKKKFVRRIQDNGWFFSIPVTVTKLEQLQHLVSTTPLSRLLTETDAPYLGPSLDAPNDATNIKHSLKTIASLKGLTEDDAANQLFMNYMRLFA